MNFFFVEPEVAGGLGDHTKMDTSVHPPVVHSLHFEFEGWLGDALLESFPAFLLTEDAGQKLVQAGLTGLEFASVQITKSEQFEDLYPARTLPSFVWLKPSGALAIDDFSCAQDGRLVVSERALKILESVGISHASVEPFDAN
jgi:hypothetical protein